MLFENVSHLFKWNMKGKTTLSCVKRKEKGRKTPLKKELQSMAGSQSDIHLVAGLRSLFSLECVTVSK